MAVPKKPLPDDFNPFPAVQPSSFVYDISSLHTYDGNLVSGLNSVVMAREKARFLMPQEVANFQQWATTHPTMDPRTWVPLARAGMHPESAAAQTIAQTDLARQIQDGTYGQPIGAPHDPPTGPQNAQPSGGTFGWLHKVADVGGTAWNDVYNATKGTARVGLTAAAAPYEALTGEFRSTAGDQHLQEQLASQYGLTKQQADTAFWGAGKGQALGTKEPNLANYGVAGLTDWPQDVQAKIQEVRDAWNTQGRPSTGQSLAGAAWGQTELSQLIEHPNLATQTLDKQGNVIQQTSWLPSKEGQQLAEANAVKAFDIRTAAEKAKGIAPIAWTPGRSLAHIWYSPDNAAFNAISGTVDAGSSIGFDPLNLVPAGATGHIVEAGKVTTKAFQRGVLRMDDVAPTVRQALRAGQKPVVVASPTARFMPGGVAGGSPIAGARAGAREAAKAAKAAGVGRVVEPALKVDEDTGRVIGPHGHFVMGQQAWDWLNRGRGTRAVNYLTNETNSHKIWLASGRKMDADLAVQLSKAATPEEVRSILGTRMGYDIRDASELGSIGRSGPALFKNRAMLDSTGLFALPGTKTFGTSGDDLAAAGAWYSAGTTRAQRANFRRLREAGVNPVSAAATSASALGVGMFRQAPSVRTLDLEDADVTMSQLDAFLRGARIDTDTASKHIDAIVKAPNGAARYAAIYGEGGALHSAVQKALTEQGLTDSHAKAITRAFEGGLSGFQRDWLNDSIPDGYAARPGNVGRALLENEQMSRAAVLPDYRTLRRTTSGLGRILTGTGDNLELASRASDFLKGTTSAWRYSVLLRPAYVMRELGELAFATSLGGYHGLFTHPGAFIAAVHQTALAKHVATTDSRLAGALTGAWARRAQIHLHEGIAHLHPSLDPQVARINGNGFWDEANKVIDGNSHEAVASMFDGLSSIHGNFQLDEAGARVSAKSARSLVRGDPDTRDAYISAFVDKLRRASGDRDMRNLASGMSREQVHREFLSGTYAVKKQMRPDLLTGSRKSRDAYLDGYRDLLSKITLGDEDLMEAVRTGKFADKQLMAPTAGRGGMFVTKELKDKIGQMLDDPNLSVQMPDVLHDFGSTYAKKRWGQGFTNDFFGSTGEWSDLFARGPLIREAYTKRVLELSPDLSPAARADVLANLRKAGDHKLARLVAATAPNPHGTLGIDEVDHIASGFARKEAERVFYDAHKRQNYALALRTVMPFAQATFNTFRRWGEMSLRNPQLMYRATKPLEALMDPGSAALYGVLANVPGGSGLRAFYTPNHPELSADGFFFTNSYGDRQYAFPMLGPLASLMPGATVNPVGLGSVSGLNVAGTSLFPGAGPALTLAESLVVPDRIYRDDNEGAVLRWMNPYGLPKGSIPDKIWGTISANWMRRLAQVSDPQQSANSTMKVIPGLASTGEYDMSSPSDQRRLVSDARGLSDVVTLLGALGVAVTPGSFTPDVLIAANGDKTGDVRRLMVADKLAQEYQKYIKPLPGVDPQVAKDQGTAQFIKDFGQTALFSVAPRTEVDGPQATNDIWHFRSQNPSAYTQNQPVIGLFFAGGDIQSEMSQNMYRWQQATGERKPKDPNQYVSDVNQTLGWLAWNAKQKDIDNLPADQQAVGRALVRSDIEKTYPGWTGKASDLGSFDRRMGQMADALKDPAVSSLASADYIETYMNTRQQALDDLEHRFGVTTLDSKTAIDAGISAQLISLAHRLRQQDTSGGFTNAWSRLFSQEFPGVESDG